jgi:hypothetical protein
MPYGDVMPPSLPIIAENACECKMSVECVCPETFRMAAFLVDKFLSGQPPRGQSSESSNKSKPDKKASHPKYYKTVVSITTISDRLSSISPYRTAANFCPQSAVP